MDNLEEINKKLLVPGHYYMPCDRDFALIEKRKMLEHIEVLTDLTILLLQHQS